MKKRDYKNPYKDKRCFFPTEKGIIKIKASYKVNFIQRENFDGFRRNPLLTTPR